MEISPPGEMGAPTTPLAECTTFCADTVGVPFAPGALTTAVTVADWPPRVPPPCTGSRATMVSEIVPALKGFQFACQMPLPMWFMASGLPLEKLSCALPVPLGPTSELQSEICASIVVDWPTTALNVV